MNVERRVVAVHLDQHDLVVIVFRDQDIELEGILLRQPWCQRRARG